MIPALFLAATLLHSPPDPLLNPGEHHFQHIRQLTFGGQNAEAYWDLAGRKLTFQTRQPQWPDEQIVEMDPDGTHRKLISTGVGRCTCSYFSPDGNWIYFSSTHERQKGAQPKLDFSKGYVWMVNPNLSMYRRSLKDGHLEKLIDHAGYVAETTIAPNGKYMVFTGAWDGNVNIYRSDLKGKNIRPLVTTTGYNGGPFVSWDSRTIVYRRTQFTGPQEVKQFHELLKQDLVRPLKMELWIMDADGTHNRQLTHLGCASFAPFLAPDNRTVIFSSNYGDPKGREFDLYTIRLDGTHLERITTAPGFDGFPMFTRDGKRIVWASNRHGSVRGETNLFVADWK